MGYARGQPTKTLLNMQWPIIVAILHAPYKDWLWAIDPDWPHLRYKMSRHRRTLFRGGDEQWTLCRFAEMEEAERFMREIGGHLFDKNDPMWGGQFRRVKFV